MQYLSVPLGSFIPWDYKKNSEMIMSELGWKIDEVENLPVSVNSHGEKIECFMQGTRDYVKYLKRGYGRALQISAFRARSGELSQDEAIALSREFDGRIPHSLQLFLDYVGLSQDEFYTIVGDSIVSPWSNEAWKKESSEKLKDFDEWYRESNS
jgi:hypothetical protein